MPQTTQGHGPRRPFHGSKKGSSTPYVVRVRTPRPDRREILGIIVEHFGSKLLVRCLDGHTRTCRIPGKIRYKLRVRAGDVVLVQKWTIQENEKGDYLYRYTKTQVNVLLRRGLIKEEDLV